MRTAEVIGRITLSERVSDLPPAALLLVRPLSAAALRDATSQTADPLVAFDSLGAAVGHRVAISEGREAAMPFHPTPAPIDAYVAAILDDVHVMKGVS